MDTPDDLGAILAQQLRYYRKQASVYDADVYLNPAARSAVLDRLAPSGRAIELACGTGLWTELLVDRVDHLTALDGAPEMLEIARQRIGDSVSFSLVDLFDWEPQDTYDTVFFSSWLSHVPPQVFPSFWIALRGALRPCGRVLFVDETPKGIEAFNEKLVTASPVPTAERTDAEGCQYKVVKVFYEHDQLCRLLAEQGWGASIWAVDDVVFAGTAMPRDRSESYPAL